MRWSAVSIYVTGKALSDLERHLESYWKRPSLSLFFSTHLRQDLRLVLFFIIFAFDPTPMLETKPAFLVNVGMNIVLVVGQFNLVPLGIVKGQLGHG